MSTRGMIARPTDTGAEGVYHHFDSYPTGLGKTLWELYHGYFERDVDAMTRYLIDDHPAGWSTINDKEFDAAPGYGSRTGPECYCHGQRNEAPTQILCSCPVMPDGEESEGCSPLFLEWMYVLSPRGLEVWTHQPVEGTQARPYNNHPDYVREVYCHVRIGTIAWDADEPDWERLESTEALAT